MILKKTNIFYIILVFIVLLFGVFNINGLEVGRDEGVHGSAARALAESGKYGLYNGDNFLMFDRRIAVGPTVIVPTALVIRFFGAGIWQLRVIPLLYFLGFILLFHFLIKKHFGFNVAVISSLLILASQWPIDRDNALFIPIYRTLTGESGALFFLTGALALFDIYFVNKRNLFLYLGAFVLGLAFLTKLQFLIAVPVLLLVLFINKSYKEFKNPFLYLLMGLPILIWFFYQYVALKDQSFMATLLSYKNFSYQSFSLSLIRIKQNIIDKWYWLNPEALKIYFTLPALIWGWRSLIKREIKSNFFILFSIIFSSIWMAWYLFSIGFIRYEIPGLYFATTFLGFYFAKQKDYFTQSLLCILLCFGFYINFREAKVVENKPSIEVSQFIESKNIKGTVETLELDYSVDYFLKNITLEHVPEGTRKNAIDSNFCYTPKSNYIISKKDDSTYECYLSKENPELIFKSGPYLVFKL